MSMPVKAASTVKPSDPLRQRNFPANISLLLAVAECFYLGYLFTSNGDPSAVSTLTPNLLSIAKVLAPIILGAIIVGVGTDGLKRANGYINTQQRLLSPAGGAWKAYIALACGYIGILIGLFLVIDGLLLAK